jgi:hypothetical protein
MSGRDAAKPVESRGNRACGLSLPVSLVIGGNRIRDRAATVPGAADLVRAAAPTQAGIHDIPSANT